MRVQVFVNQFTYSEYINYLPWRVHCFISYKWWPRRDAQLSLNCLAESLEKRRALHRDLTKLCTIWSRVSIKICRLYCLHFSMLYGLPGTFHLLGKKLLSWFWNVEDVFSVTCYRWIVLTSCLISCYTTTVNGNVLLPLKWVMYEACTATRLLFHASLKTLGAI